MRIGSVPADVAAPRRAPRAFLSAGIAIPWTAAAAVLALVPAPARAADAAPPAAPAPPASAPASAPEPAPASAPEPESAPAEPLLLAGRVLEAGTRTPLGGVEIVVKDTELYAVTEEDGRFEIRTSKPPKGDVRVLVAAAGYVLLEVIESADDRPHWTRVVYYLRRDSAAPMKTTTREKAPVAETTVRTLTREELSAIPGASDPVRALSTMPGVARAPLGIPFLLVRGSEPRDTPVFVEGHPIPILYHLIGFETTLSSDMLSGLEFYPGAVPPRFGRGHGGAVELRLRDDLPKRWAGHIQTDTLATSVFVEVPIGRKAGLYLSAARSYIDFELRAIEPLLADAGLELGLVVAPRYYDYSAMFVAKPWPGHTMRVIWFGSDDRASLVDEDMDSIRAITWYHRGLATWKAKLEKGLTNDLSVSMGFSRLKGGFAADIDVTIDNLDFAMREELVATLTKGFDLALGLDLLVARPRWDLYINGGIFDDDEEGNIFTLDEAELVPDVAAYVEARLEPVKGVRILPGVRFDYYFLAQDGIVDPRLSARWAVHDMVTLKASVGRYGEPPNTFDTGIGPDRALVDASWSLQWTAGAEVRPFPRVLLDVEFFHKELWSLNNGGFADTGGTGRNETTGDVFDPSLRTGRGRVLGLEVLARMDPGGPFYGWIAYTLSKSDRWDGAVPGDPHEPSDFDQRHILAVVAAYAAPKGWRFGLRFRLSSGAYYDPLVRGPWLADEDAWQALPGERRRFPPFNSLDVRAEKGWTFDTWAFKFYVEILNVYVSKNPEDVVYSRDYRDHEFTRGLPLIPQIGARADF